MREKRTGECRLPDGGSFACPLSRRSGAPDQRGEKISHIAERTPRLYGRSTRPCHHDCHADTSARCEQALSAFVRNTAELHDEPQRPLAELSRSWL